MLFKVLIRVQIYVVSDTDYYTLDDVSSIGLLWKNACALHILDSDKCHL